MKVAAAARSKTPPELRGAPAASPPSPRGESWAAVAGPMALSVLLFSLIFPPLTWWPLALICLAPWALAVCRTTRPWLAYWLSFAAGWLFFLINLSWLRPVTGLGFVALAFYLAAYFPLAAFAVRTGLRRGFAPVWTLPVAWVACEFLRAFVMSGFPWLFVGHAFYRQLWLIQISDLVGAYGVSFVALAINGALATILLARFGGGPMPIRRRQALLGTLFAAALLAASVGYSLARWLPPEQYERGPRVAVIQEDFPLVSTPPYGEPAHVTFARYMVLAARAAQSRPDLIVFPETAWGAKQNAEFLAREPRSIDKTIPGHWRFGRLCHEGTAAFARGDYAGLNAVIERFRAADPERQIPTVSHAGGPPVTVVVGTMALEILSDVAYPNHRRFNSAVVYDPDGTQQSERYDKNHLVPFGEFVPFRFGRLHFLYRWLNSLSPFSDGGRVEYSLTAGDGLTVFRLTTGDREWRYGTPICYEDVMPYVIRRFVWDGAQRRVDFLLNMSNDGWFQYSAELPQHLAICVFRAVENRVGFARAVNTGISAFIDPSGRIYSEVRGEDGRRYGPGVIGYRTDHVLVDRRASVYGRSGDIFAGACLALTAGLWIIGVGTAWVGSAVQRLRRARPTGGV